MDVYILRKDSSFHRLSQWQEGRGRPDSKIPLIGEGAQLWIDLVMVW